MTVRRAVIKSDSSEGITDSPPISIVGITKTFNGLSGIAVSVITLPTRAKVESGASDDNDTSVKTGTRRSMITSVPEEVIEETSAPMLPAKSE